MFSLTLDRTQKQSASLSDRIAALEEQYTAARTDYAAAELEREEGIDGADRRANTLYDRMQDLSRQIASARAAQGEYTRQQHVLKERAAAEQLEQNRKKALAVRAKLYRTARETDKAAQAFVALVGRLGAQSSELRQLGLPDAAVAYLNTERVLATIARDQGVKTFPIGRNAFLDTKGFADLVPPETAIIEKFKKKE